MSHGVGIGERLEAWQCAKRKTSQRYSGRFWRSGTVQCDMSRRRGCQADRFHGLRPVQSIRADPPAHLTGSKHQPQPVMVRHRGNRRFAHIPAFRVNLLVASIRPDAQLSDATVAREMKPKRWARLAISKKNPRAG